MSSSIKTGLNELSGNTKSFFICLSDMPLVTYDVYNLINQDLVFLARIFQYSHAY